MNRKQIRERTETALQDTANKHWSDCELNTYIDDALNEFTRRVRYPQVEGYATNGSSGTTIGEATKTGTLTTDSKTALVIFNTTNLQAEANVWVTWVVRDLGEGVLGHANLGKGVVEVAIGSYGCDGSFQLFDTNTVEYIMSHELGHSLGLGHSDDPDELMYPTIPYTGYEYCLLN